MRVSAHAAGRLIATAPARLASPKSGLRLLAFLVLALIGLLTLVALDFVQNSGLWGDFIFAFIVTAVVIALAGHAIPNKRWEKWGIAPPTSTYAPFWAMFILLDIPLAIVSFWYGPPALLLLLVLLWITLPDARLAVLLTTALMLLLVGVVSAHTGAKQPRVSSTISLSGADAIAHRYRPILLFDSREQYAPVDIGRAIAAGHVSACHRTIRGDNCAQIKNADELSSDVDFVQVKASNLGPGDNSGGPDSAIYYHVVATTNPPRVYIDYWWFFTENPEPVLSAVLCRAGLHLGEITCFQHEADWEGMTVILAPCEVQPGANTNCISFAERHVHLIAVAYAEHGGPAKLFIWQTLQQRWTQSSAPTEGERPVVYVALNSHAAYPHKCPPGCGREQSNNGGAPWDNNGTTCITPSSDCVRPLPIDTTGKPSAWNAYPGPWGAQHCILDGAYCDGGPAPRGPALHARYSNPGLVH